MHIAHDKAFTLIELVIAIVVISVSITGTMLAFQIVATNSATPMLTQQSVSIAKSYMDEILSKKFPITLPCPAPPIAGRSEYSNICDYQNLNDIGANSQMGTAISELSNYTVTVSIDGTTASLDTLTAGSEVVRIDVTVTHNSAEAVTISAYRTSY